MASATATERLSLVPGSDTRKKRPTLPHILATICTEPTVNGDIFLERAHVLLSTRFDWRARIACNCTFRGGFLSERNKKISSNCVDRTGETSPIWRLWCAARFFVVVSRLRLYLRAIEANAIDTHINGLYAACYRDARRCVILSHLARECNWMWDAWAGEEKGRDEVSGWLGRETAVVHTLIHSIQEWFIVSNVKHTVRYCSA